jgi:hypothetical protein
MRKRRKMNFKKSRKLFRKTANKTHYFNTQLFEQRGGLRL